MKLLLLVLVVGLTVVTAGVPDDIVEKFHKVVSENNDKCLQESGADMKDVLDGNGTTEHSKAEKCYYKCIYTGLNVYDSNGQLDAEKFSQKFTWVSSGDAAKCMFKDVTDDDCHRSFLITQCIVGGFSV